MLRQSSILQSRNFFRPCFDALAAPSCVRYASHSLSRTVSRPGQGKTTVAKKKPQLKPARAQRLQASLKKTRTVRPTTLGMSPKFASLQAVPVEERRAHKNLFDKVSTFDELRIHPEVRDNIAVALLAPTAITGPTPVQKLAIKALYKSRKAQSGLNSWLIAAETGSGKTLAYLAPVLSTLAEQISEAQVRGPRLSAAVLVPTLELVAQVGQVAARLAPEGLRVAELGAGKRNSEVAQKITQGLDLLVTTPDKMLNLFGHHASLAERALPHCRWLVVDEADSLMNKSFTESTLKVIKSCEQLEDLVFCTATIPSFFEKTLRTSFPETTRLVTPSLHRLPRHVDFRVIETFKAPYSGNKELALQQALYSIYNDNTEMDSVKRVVVFVNRKDSISHLVDMLNNKSYPTAGLDGSLAAEDRAQLLDEFLSPPRAAKSAHDRLSVLVASDLAARGLDMNRVRNIILYDMPQTAADLLHRAGRTGRINGKGRVFLLVSRKESASWVKGLEKVVKQGHALA